MTDIVNKKKKVSVGNIIKLLFIIIGLFLLSSHILSKIDWAVKKDMMYEILLQYVSEHDDKIDIKNSIVKDIKVDYDIYDVYYFGDKKPKYEYIYNFQTRLLNVYSSDSNDDYERHYYYDYDYYLEKYDVKVIFGYFFSIWYFLKLYIVI